MLPRHSYAEMLFPALLPTLLPTEARSLGAFVTKPDNKVSRILKVLLRELPEAMEQVAAASLAASLALAEAPEGAAPDPAGNRLTDRHKLIQALQVGECALEGGGRWLDEVWVWLVCVLALSGIEAGVHGCDDDGGCV